MTFHIQSFFSRLLFRPEPSARVHRRVRRRRRRLLRRVPSEELYENRRWVTEAFVARRKAMIVTTLIYKKVVLKPCGDSESVEDNVLEKDGSNKNETLSVMQDKNDLVISEHDRENIEDADCMGNCCVICLDHYEEGDEICWSHNPNCYHAFHRDCIEKWLMRHDDCPQCRVNYLLSPLDVNKEGPKDEPVQKERKRTDSSETYITTFPSMGSEMPEGCITIEIQ